MIQRYINSYDCLWFCMLKYSFFIIILTQVDTFFSYSVDGNLSLYTLCSVCESDVQFKLFVFIILIQISWKFLPASFGWTKVQTTHTWITAVFLVLCWEWVIYSVNDFSHRGATVGVKRNNILECYFMTYLRI